MLLEQDTYYTNKYRALTDNIWLVFIRFDDNDAQNTAQKKIQYILIVYEFLIDPILQMSAPTICQIYISICVETAFYKIECGLTTSSEILWINFFSINVALAR
jgi:hypothetical protein